jgi:phenylacetate-CoA ligase
LALDIATRVHRAVIRGYETTIKGRRNFAYAGELQRSQWFSREQLEALQLTRLRALLTHASVHSPWHVASWRTQGLELSQLQSLADFQRWPVVDREAVRAQHEQIRASGAGRGLIAKATGGSSGVPVHFYISEESNQRRMAAWDRGYGWAGAGAGTRQWLLWGVAPSSTAGWRKHKQAGYDRLYRRTTCSCFDLSEASVPEFAASLARTRPDAIVAYTNSLYQFARMLEAQRLVPFSPGSIVVGAEKLHPFQREVIERVFRAPVFETYGSREFMLMAAECDQHQGLHLTMEHLLVEVLDDEGAPVPAGVTGNVVVTDLTNFGMPFVRYATGDQARAADHACTCGRGLPLLSEITGRTVEIITTRSGQQLTGLFFPHMFKELPSVRQFQVVQEELDRISIKLVATPEWNVRDETWLRQEISAATNNELTVDLEIVASIALTPAGKLQPVLSRISAITAGTVR